MKGNAGEVCAKEYSFTREQQDAFAIESYKRALKAIEVNNWNSDAWLELLRFDY